MVDPPFGNEASTAAAVAAFGAGAAVFDLGREAESIAKIAQAKMDKEGTRAKIHCSNIVEWMNALAEAAQKALDSHLKKNAQQ